MHTASLITKKCIPCEGSAQPLQAQAIEEYRSELKLEWEVIDDKKISRLFKFKNFKEAMAFVNKVAQLAEEEGHHPDISISWNKVTLELTTHAIGGLSENDFILASKIEQFL